MSEENEKDLAQLAVDTRILTAPSVKTHFVGAADIGEESSGVTVRLDMVVVPSRDKPYVTTRKGLTDVYLEALRRKYKEAASETLVEGDITMLMLESMHDTLAAFDEALAPEMLALKWSLIEGENAIEVALSTTGDFSEGAYGAPADLFSMFAGGM